MQGRPRPVIIKSAPRIRMRVSNQTTTKRTGGTTGTAPPIGVRVGARVRVGVGVRGPRPEGTGPTQQAQRTTPLGRPGLACVGLSFDWPSALVSLWSIYYPKHADEVASPTETRPCSWRLEPGGNKPHKARKYAVRLCIGHLESSRG